MVSFCVCVCSVCGDSLERVTYNNPGLVVDLGVGLWAWPLPMDYDQDGDYDLVVSCNDKPFNGIYFFENTQGDTRMPVFEPPKKLTHARNHIQISYVDGKELLLARNEQFVDFRENNFSRAVKIYPQNNIHEKGRKIRANQWKFSDFDGDDDLDLIVGVGDWQDYGWDNAYDETGRWQNGPLRGYVYLIRNNGSTDNPAYAEPEKIQAGGSPIDVYGMPSPNFADFDGDGDLDIICGEFIDTFTYFENTGSRQSPHYAKGRLLKSDGQVIKMDLCMIVPVAIDWDKDGDVDLIVGQEDGRVAFVENTGTLRQGVPQFLPPVFFRQKAEFLKFGALVTPYSYDWDNDGDEDLICGNTAGRIGFIENLGLNGDTPKWAEPVRLEADGKVFRVMAGENGSIQGPCETKWGYTVLTVADWDHDGLADIVANSILGQIFWLKNTGTRNAPKLAAAQPVQVEWDSTPPKPAWNWRQPEAGELVTQWRSSLIVRDFTHDGLNDLVVMDHEGYLSLFERFKQDGQLKLHPGKRIFYGKGGCVFDAKGKAQNESDGLLQLNDGAAGRSGRRKFCMADWDQDGQPDLLVNSVNVNVLKNMSDSVGACTFTDKGMADSRILAGHTTCPAVVDWNKDGAADLFVGGEDGHFYYVPNPNSHHDNESRTARASRYKSLKNR